MSDEILADGVGTALGGKGSPCPIVKLWDKTWKIGWPTYESHMHLELLVAEYAEENNELRKRRKSKEKSAKLDADLENSIRGGAHKAFGALWSSVIDGPDGMAVCLLSLLLEHQPDATIAEAKVLWGSAARQVRLAIAQVMPSFCKLLCESPLIEEEYRESRAATFLSIMLERISPPPVPETLPTLTQTKLPTKEPIVSG